ncbi:hypothetical protein B5807_02857 [Epicoccum nigrum]|jgi:hypothetical protein|uniref:Uncharacterized protein n=1 Tax=Epicoccum nigrum TaxID=105696 RepID=A0A1Y2M9X2_EPING|nr:hypothetical protein B5807_02857 [Epicoccum nigrum]
MRGVRHLFLSDNTLGKSRLRYFPLSSGWKVPWAGTECRDKRNSASAFSIIISRSYHDHGIGGLHYSPKLLGLRPLGGTNGAERELDIADVQILDIEACAMNDPSPTLPL